MDKKQKISLETSVGKICVETNPSLDVPNVSVYIEPVGSTEQIDLVSVEQATPEAIENSYSEGAVGDLNLYVYGNPYSDEFTERVVVSQSDLAKIAITEDPVNWYEKTLIDEETGWSIHQRGDLIVYYDHDEKTFSFLEEVERFKPEEYENITDLNELEHLCKKDFSIRGELDDFSAMVFWKERVWKEHC